MSGHDDFDMISPAPAGQVTLGEGPEATSVVVKAMKVGQLPAFARALRPLSGEVERLMMDGLTVNGVMGLIENHFEDAVAVLHAATGAPPEAIREATLDQALELFLAVLGANKDFLRGRLAAALKTAAAIPGAGLTP